MKQLSDEEALLLAEPIPVDPGLYEPPPDPTAPDLEPPAWNLVLPPNKAEAWEDPTENIVICGEKGSGKSFLGLAMLVRHCYENNAVALIIASTIRVAIQGSLRELETRVLPTFKYGNLEPDYLEDGTKNPRAGQRMDSGMGLEYTETKSDPLTKDKYLYIRNRFGQWSLVIVVSILHPSLVEDRIKGITPSFVYVEELANCRGPEYFTYVSAQLGRLPGVDGPQQYVGSCNPEGPSHWMYDQMHIRDAIDGHTKYPVRGFAYHHIPVTENVGFLSTTYIQRLNDVLKDPVERMRLIDGIWVDRPSGEAIFKDSYMPEIHVIGEEDGRDCIVPRKDLPCIVGYDPGPVNFSVHFIQPVPTLEGTLWTVFDEVNLVNMRMLYEAVVKRVLHRMDYWKERAGIVGWHHVIDDAAFTHQNSRGSYDATDIQKYSNGRIRLKGCPKGKDSAPTRARTLHTLLLADMIAISSHCTGTKGMLLGLESEKVPEGKYDEYAGFRPKRSIYIHPFDSLTYPIHYYTYVPSAKYWTVGQEYKVTPQVYRAGAG